MNQSDPMWKCTVCGYIHYGDKAPENCPVCGATADLFEKEESLPQKRTVVVSSGKWRCLNCEYIHKGDTPPSECPVCGLSDESFEAIEEVVESDNLQLPEENIVIIGGGIAGFSAAEAARKHNSSAILTILSAEKHHPYYRLNLTRYLAGEIESFQLPLQSTDWFDKNNILFKGGCPVTSIDKEKKEVRTGSGEILQFDKLIITMGSHPFIPPFPGASRKNVMALRTKDDAEAILALCRHIKSVVIIGGGLLGLEAAGALAECGAHVSLVEGSGWLLPRQLNESAGRILGEIVKSKGISIVSCGSVKSIDGDESVHAVTLEDGRVLNADLVLISTGVRPNSYMGRMAGLNVNRGIIVNDYLETSESHIYAAGDVAEHRGVCYGTWGPSSFQGTIAGMNAVGLKSQFAGIPRSNLLKVLGYDMFSIGQIRGDDASYTTLEHRIGSFYYAFILQDQCLVGSILMGDSSLSSQVKNLIEGKYSCSAIEPSLMSGETFYQWVKNYSHS